MLAFAVVAKNPDPSLQITSYKGVTRTLDDWATVFNLAVIVLPDRPEGAGFVPVVDRIFATFGDSDVRCIVCVPSTKAIAKRILGDAVDRWMTWCDPDRAHVAVAEGPEDAIDDRDEPRAFRPVGEDDQGDAEDRRPVVERAGHALVARDREYRVGVLRHGRAR